MEHQQKLQEDSFKKHVRDFQQQVGVWVFYPTPEKKRGNDGFRK
jgi:hypothetical protein